MNRLGLHSQLLQSDVTIPTRSFRWPREISDDPVGRQSPLSQLITFEKGEPFRTAMVWIRQGKDQAVSHHL
ncbi:hypothetical protein DAPPUDRAFT_233622 [Daphnia pulex]|uniref:Uncharacterized protein n=1 Tax=Daphnia pulex TaxID=6669 RepID=E9FVA2_DAPPU|nr:hypothetical protein DAPPUDRAFT_233622 [Daphnia pulex]|eukprot:EFX88525.1 hypothetical protein DAPPUDRAFT_233622 [Daphnia pulex]